jgi:phosphatidylserine decarboxylase
VWLKNGLIRQFIQAFAVDMSEAAEPDYTRYACFNEFFTRPLLEGARPLAKADILCPADGAISQLGAISSGMLFQAKGRQFSTEDLLGGDKVRAAQFNGGQFATVYLSPKDYHRVHMPVAGRLTATRYIPGQLFSVNGVTAENVDRLFARNERLVCHFETEFGPMAMILVGAMVVAGIETVWSGRVAPPSKCPMSLDYVHLPAPVELAQGDEMGRFMLGSTVILLFPRDVMSFGEHYEAGTLTRMGESLGSRQ